MRCKTEWGTCKKQEMSSRPLNRPSFDDSCSSWRSCERRDIILNLPERKTTKCLKAACSNVGFGSLDEPPGPWLLPVSNKRVKVTGSSALSGLQICSKITGIHQPSLTRACLLSPADVRGKEWFRLLTILIISGIEGLTVMTAEVKSFLHVASTSVEVTCLLGNIKPVCLKNRTMKIHRGFGCGKPKSSWNHGLPRRGWDWNQSPHTILYIKRNLETQIHFLRV